MEYYCLCLEELVTEYSSFLSTYLVLFEINQLIINIDQIGF